MKEKAFEGTYSRGGLNAGVYLEPIEKRFDWLPAAANIGVEAITRFQNIIRPFLSGSSKDNGYEKGKVMRSEILEAAPKSSR